MHGVDDYVHYMHVYVHVYMQYIQHAGFILRVTVYDDMYMLKKNVHFKL